MDTETAVFLFGVVILIVGMAVTAMFKAALVVA